jgi:tetratricopeptide (TPR) repeat protein
LVIENLTSIARSSGDLATLDLLARAGQLTRDKAPQSAVELLQRIGHAQRLVSEMRVEAVRQAAGIVEELDAPEQAIELFRTYATNSSRPEALLDLARCLGRQGRVSEAITLCEENWDRLAFSEVTTTAVALLRHGNLRGPEAIKVAERVQQKLSATPEPEQRVELLLLMADLQDLQANYDEAQLLFEEVLVHRKNHVLARNNLAFLLANRKGAERALKLIDEAIAIAGPVPELLDTKGFVLILAGQPEAAISVLADASNSQDSSLIRLHSAEAHRLCGNPMRSKDELEKAMSLGLKPGTLHPFDRAVYDRLEAELHVAENR